MKRPITAIVTAVAVLLAVLLPLGLGAGAQAPPGSTTRAQFRAPGQPLNGPFEVVHLILDFAPGAWTPLHTHGGQGVVTVLSGTMTRREQGAETVYKAGQGWVETPGREHAAGNLTTEPASVFVTFLLPKGAPLTTTQGGGGQQGVPGPTTRYQFRTEGVPLAAPFEVVQLVLDFVPGAWTPPHTHGGQGVVMVLDGTMTRRSEGVEAVFRPGESWVEPGVVHEAGNATANRATVMVTFLLPKGAPLTTVGTPGLPNTGAGGVDRWTLYLWLALLLGAGLGVGTSLMWGRSRRAGA